MVRALNKLTARAALTVAEPGRHSDGGGLYLDITKTGSKSWVFFYRSPVHRTTKDGKTVGRWREMGLGAYGAETDKVSLAAARDLAEAARKLIKDGLDPLDERNRVVTPVARVPTFGEMADQLIKAMSPSWRNEKHREQWVMTLKEYAAPLRKKPVNEIDVADVLACLNPHWEQRPETAGRLRGRIERVLNAAKAQGHRTGENPAAWRGHLENLLPKRGKLTRGHYDALPWADVPDFLDKLRKRAGLAAITLEFTILTAARSGEARGAHWDEFDLAAKVWTIPAKRMKVNTTVHGFRSSFRDWCGDTTSFPREIAEAALAHTIGNKVEVTYRRGDALERRRELMAAWEQYCTAPVGGNVVELRREA